MEEYDSLQLFLKSIDESWITRDLFHPVKLLSLVDKPYFIDKTLFIRNIITSNHRIIFITTPHFFPKAYNIIMLRCFLEMHVDAVGMIINRETSRCFKFFKKHQPIIYQDQDFFYAYFATYSVVYFNMGMIPVQYITQIFSYSVKMSVLIRFYLKLSFCQHYYLVTSKKLDQEEKNQFLKYCDSSSYRSLDLNEVVNGLQFLSKCLYKHFNGKKVFLIITEYDAHIKNISMIDEVVYDIFQEFYELISKSINNEYVDKVVITGTYYLDFLRACEYNENIERFSFHQDHQFTQFLTLTNEELMYILNKLNFDNYSKNFIRMYYQQYIRTDGLLLYSLSTILQLEKFKQIGVLKVPANDYSLNSILHFVNIPIIKYALQKLCTNQSLIIEVTEIFSADNIFEIKKYRSNVAGVYYLEKPDLYLSFLLHKGYLKYDGRIHENYWKVKAANNSVITELINELQTDSLTFYSSELPFFSADSEIRECAFLFNKITPNAKDKVFIEFLFHFYKIHYRINYRPRLNYKILLHRLMFEILSYTDFHLGDDGLTFTDRILDLIFYKENLGMIVTIEYEYYSNYPLNPYIQIHTSSLNETSHFIDITDKMYLNLSICNKILHLYVSIDHRHYAMNRCFKITEEEFLREMESRNEFVSRSTSEGLNGDIRLCLA